MYNFFGNPEDMIAGPSSPRRSPSPSPSRSSRSGSPLSALSRASSNRFNPYARAGSSSDESRTSSPVSFTSTFSEPNMNTDSLGSREIDLSYLPSMVQEASTLADNLKTLMEDRPSLFGNKFAKGQKVVDDLKKFSQLIDQIVRYSRSEDYKIRLNGLVVQFGEKIADAMEALLRGITNYSDLLIDIIPTSYVKEGVKNYKNDTFVLDIEPQLRQLELYSEQLLQCQSGKQGSMRKAQRLVNEMIVGVLNRIKDLKELTKGRTTPHQQLKALRDMKQRYSQLEVKLKDLCGELMEPTVRPSGQRYAMLNPIRRQATKFY